MNKRQAFDGLAPQGFSYNEFSVALKRTAIIKRFHADNVDNVRTVKIIRNWTFFLGGSYAKKGQKYKAGGEKALHMAPYRILE